MPVNARHASVHVGRARGWCSSAENEGRRLAVCVRPGDNPSFREVTHVPIWMAKASSEPVFGAAEADAIPAFTLSELEERTMLSLVSGVVADINQQVANGQTGSADPSNLTVLNGTLYFSANDGIHGTQLWKSDGTAAGTTMVTDLETIIPGYRL